MQAAANLLMKGLLSGSGEDCGYNSARSAEVAELAEVYALPAPQVQASVGYGYSEAHSGQSRFGVCRHVVGPFKGVAVKRGVFRHYLVEDEGEVGPHVGIGIFVDCEAAGGMFYEDMKQSARGQHASKGGEDFVGHKVTPAAACRKADFGLSYHFISGVGLLSVGGVEAVALLLDMPFASHACPQAVVDE